MTLHVRDAATWKQVTSLQVRDAGTWKPVQAGYVRDAGTWKQFYSVSGGGGGGGGYSVSISPSPAEAFKQTYDFKPQSYVSIGLTATPTGFTNPTYSWSRVSGVSGAGAFSCSPTNAASTTIGCTIPAYIDYNETWRCTVTEGANSAYADVTVTLRYENGL